MEFYYMIHYVIYRFYRKHKESPSSAMGRAVQILMLLAMILLVEIDYFCHKSIGITFFPNIVVFFSYPFLAVIIEYVIFIRKGRYKEIFNTFDEEIETPEMDEKLKKAKIFNYSLLAIDLILLFTVDYLNHHPYLWSWILDWRYLSGLNSMKGMSVYMM